MRGGDAGDLALSGRVNMGFPGPARPCDNCGAQVTLRLHANPGGVATAAGSWVCSICAGKLTGGTLFRFHYTEPDTATGETVHISHAVDLKTGQEHRVEVGRRPSTGDETVDTEWGDEE